MRQPRQRSPIEPILYDRSRAADALSISETTLDAYTKMGALRAVRKGGKVMYTRAALDLFAERDDPSPFIPSNAYSFEQIKRKRKSA